VRLADGAQTEAKAEAKAEARGPYAIEQVAGPVVTLSGLDY